MHGQQNIKNYGNIVEQVLTNKRPNVDAVHYINWLI